MLVVNSPFKYYILAVALCVFLFTQCTLLSQALPSTKRYRKPATSPAELVMGWDVQVLFFLGKKV